MHGLVKNFNEKRIGTEKNKMKMLNFFFMLIRQTTLSSIRTQQSKNIKLCIKFIHGCENNMK